jgi:hypothetical protein
MDGSGDVEDPAEAKNAIGILIARIGHEHLGDCTRREDQHRNMTLRGHMASQLHKETAIQNMRGVLANEFGPELVTLRTFLFKFIGLRGIACSFNDQSLLGDFWGAQSYMCRLALNMKPPAVIPRDAIEFFNAILERMLDTHFIYYGEQLEPVPLVENMLLCTIPGGITFEEIHTYLGLGHRLHEHIRERCHTNFPDFARYNENNEEPLVPDDWIVSLVHECRSKLEQLIRIKDDVQYAYIPVTQITVTSTEVNLPPAIDSMIKDMRWKVIFPIPANFSLPLSILRKCF